MRPVTDNDLKLLQVLRSGPKTNRDLQEQAGMHRRSIFTSLRRLETYGLVMRRPLLRDARMTVWSLTAVTYAGSQFVATQS